MSGIARFSPLPVFVWPVFKWSKRKKCFETWKIIWNSYFRFSEQSFLGTQAQPFAGQWPLSTTTAELNCNDKDWPTMPQRFTMALHRKGVPTPDVCLSVHEKKKLLWQEWPDCSLIPSVDLAHMFPTCVHRHLELPTDRAVHWLDSFMYVTGCGTGHLPDAPDGP